VLRRVRVDDPNSAALHVHLRHLGEFMAWSSDGTSFSSISQLGNVAVGWTLHPALLAEFDVVCRRAWPLLPCVEHGHLAPAAPYSTYRPCGRPFPHRAAGARIKESDVNHAMVVTKVGVLVVFVAFGVGTCCIIPVRRANLTPFIPANTGKFGEFAGAHL